LRGRTDPPGPRRCRTPAANQVPADAGGTVLVGMALLAVALRRNAGTRADR
jgi:hypothetical protein